MILIGPPALCRRLERRLDELADRPRTVGWVTTVREAETEGPILGAIDELETIAQRHGPDLALISVPAVMGELVERIRMRLRLLGVEDRVVPPIEDVVRGIGVEHPVRVDPGRLIDRPCRPIDERAIRAAIADRRVVVTGAGGSIGSELARCIASYDPAHLGLLDRAETALFEIDRQVARIAPDLPRSARLLDVADGAATQRIFRELRPDVVLHAAAHKHVPMMEDHPGEAVDNNLFGTRSAADAAHVVEADRFVLISTDKAVNPRSIMGATKRLAELYVQDRQRTSATCFGIVRFGNVLGSSGSVLDVWSRQIAEGGPLTVTHEAMTRYFMTLPESAQLVIQTTAMLDRETGPGDVFVLDMGEPVRIVDLARRFAALHGLRAVRPGEAAPEDGGRSIAIVNTGPRPGEKMHEELAFDSATMRRSHHPGVNIWTLQPPPDRYMEGVLRSLAPGVRPVRPEEVAALVRKLAAGAERREREGARQ